MTGATRTEPIGAAPRSAESASRRRGPRRRRKGGFDRPRFLKLWTALVYVFLFVPIAVVILFSFNGQKSLQVIEGFSWQWYEDFFNDASLKASLVMSLEVAALTMLAATVLGTLLAIGLVRSRGRFTGSANVLMLIPLVIPEIVAGISALLLFSRLGIQLSFLTVVIAHITFSISYVTIVVRARLASMGRDAEEAAMDLGATRWQSVRLVLIPNLWPAVIAAGLLCFALSFDDFVLSYFTTGLDTQPLPVRIWSAIRFGPTPAINALGTIMMVVSLTAVALAVLIPRVFGRKESGVNVLKAGG
ncbi:ABC transporter permease [Thermoleophilia bacterium SCSIO 60948]|nr:ABC transporter permease [Thermoleophilia bacterium SCSIO 60948]